MTILTFILLLALANFICIILDSLLNFFESKLVPYATARKKIEMERRYIEWDALGLPFTRSEIFEVSPSNSHILAYYSKSTSLVLFVILAIANALIVSRFVSNPERIDWIWYLIPLANLNPLSSMTKSIAIPAWIYMVGLLVYIATCIYVR